MKCTRKLGWEGGCRKEAVEGDTMCEEHKDEKCSKCSKRAVNNCGYCGFLVCGQPLCEDCKCEH